MEDPRDNRVHTDDNGDRWLTGENGKLLKDENGNNIPPNKARVIGTSSGWTDYDTSQGHCGLCGKLSCRGNCFK